MNCLVLIEICFCCKSLVTLAAMIWVLPSVTSLMYFKIVFLYKRLITIAAMIWFHPNVKCFMNLKFVFLCKSFVTFTTFIWYCLSMIPLMTWQMMFFLQKPYYSICIDLFFPHCGFFDGNWDLFFVWKPCHTGCNDIVSPQCEFFDVYHDFFYCESIITLAALILFIISVTFLMYFKMSFRCKKPCYICCNDMSSLLEKYACSHHVGIR